MAITKILSRAPQARERRAALRMTGRYLLTAQKGGHDEIAAKLSASGFGAAIPVPHGVTAARALPRGNHLMLSRVGVAVVDPLPEQEEALQRLAAQEDAVAALEPERIVRAVRQDTLSGYLRGWRDAVDALAAKLIEEPPPARATAAAAPLATWGLFATKVLNSRFSGAGLKVCVLDTGLDLTHPDFAGRPIVTQNFVGDNAQFHDGVGHGTHCVGTAAGPLHPQTGPRYSIAYESQIFVGRVLDDTGHGGDFNILQGINWAIEQGCEVVSLSLEAPWIPGDSPFSQAYETAAQQALQAGCLLVVAAGNEADDPRFIGAVGTPGNSPSVLTVAAVDHTLATAPFSNRARGDAPGVKGPDLAGPGVDVYSAWLVADRPYNTISGTSMATPHVAGIAALYAQANPGVRGQALKDLIVNRCLALPDGSSRQGEIGSGLVQAPTDH
jgi:subtilisin family serine protease